MVLWTIMPLEAVFPEEFNPLYEELDYAGTKLEVEKTTANQCRIVRILSTNPQDYLRQDIKPGTLINYGPIL